MNDSRRIAVSKYLSYHLRHRPDQLGLTLESGGWVGVSDLLDAAAAARFRITPEELQEVVERCDKQRFAFDETGERIRANQGHSVEVDLQLDPKAPPAVLYHGTSTKHLTAVLESGLKRMKRHHVHLSPTPETARKVGARHGKPVVLVVDAAALHAAGGVFYESANGVWLADEVPAQYLRPL